MDEEENNMLFVTRKILVHATFSVNINYSS